MDITPYVDGLRRDLVAAAEAGGDDVRQAAERLAYALDPSARLALMEALSQAAAEITAELPDGAVEVRLDGRELAFAVSASTPPAPPAAPAPPPPPVDDGDEGGQTRVTLRLPEQVKTRAEDKAARAGQSLNTWLVSVIRAASQDRGISVDVDLSSIPFVGYDPFQTSKRSQRRMTGWI